MIALIQSYVERLVIVKLRSACYDLNCHGGARLRERAERYSWNLLGHASAGK